MPQRDGGDYAWGRPSIAAMQAAGWTFVSRYLSYDTSKNLTPDEARTLQAGGIDIVSNWENYGDWSHDYSGGYNTGRIHAQEADRQHRACGGPPNRPIYFSTDFDPTPAQLPTIADYYRGAASVIGPARVGAYGGYHTIRYLFDAGVIRWGWQTYAWSYFQDTQTSVSYLHWDPRAQVRQVRNGVLIGGVDCDLDTALVDDIGQWSYDPATTAPQGDTMLILAKTHDDPTVVAGDGITRRKVADGAELARLQDRVRAAGGDAGIVVYDSWEQVYGVVGRVDADNPPTAPAAPPLVASDAALAALAEQIGALLAPAVVPLVTAAVHGGIDGARIVAAS